MPESAAIRYQTDDPALGFGVERLIASLRDAGMTVLHGEDPSAGEATIELTLAPPSSGLDEEGFEIARDGATVTVTGGARTGMMYGTLELAEHVDRGRSLLDVPPINRQPAVRFRAIKFNLPWSPYRSGAQTAIHYDTCRDIDFWRSFLDMMAAHRFNALTLWNLHPFPYLIRPNAYPEACPFSPAELAEWQEFWHSLFGMAAERCIDTYLLNWNIVVSDAFAEAYDVDPFDDRSDIVKAYTRECVTQTIDTYPELTGLGVSLCDWMSGMNPEDKQAWFAETFLEGIARANRPVSLLNRSVLTESIDAMRETITDAASIENVDAVRVPTKFNWSHGHSTTSLELTHDYSSGAVDEALWNPPPEEYSIVWTVRNEDCFLLRWGDRSNFQ